MPISGDGSNQLMNWGFIDQFDVQMNDLAKMQDGTKGKIGTIEQSDGKAITVRQFDIESVTQYLQAKKEGRSTEGLDHDMFRQLCEGTQKGNLVAFSDNEFKVLQDNSHLNKIKNLGDFEIHIIEIPKKADVQARDVFDQVHAPSQRNAAAAPAATVRTIKVKQVSYIDKTSYEKIQTLSQNIFQQIDQQARKEEPPPSLNDRISREPPREQKMLPAPQLRLQLTKINQSSSSPVKLANQLYAERMEKHAEEDAHAEKQSEHKKEIHKDIREYDLEQTAIHDASIKQQAVDETHR